MSLFVASLNSGSNGNCYYIGNHTEAILVDAGISCRETEKRMRRLGLSIQSVKAIFISHEHSDHINGLTLLAKNYNLPVYITSDTLKNSGLVIPQELVKTFKIFEKIVIGKLAINSFSKHHDARDPCSFTITSDNIHVGVFTDIGLPCKNLTTHFSQCHAAFLEANYDEQMLESGTYPGHLKRRISSGKGHLSNRQALEVFLSHRPSYMTHLFLSHLSRNNNCPELVHKLFSDNAGKVKIVVASRYQETPVYHITHTETCPLTLPARKASVSQLSLSFA